MLKECHRREDPRSGRAIANRLLLFVRQPDFGIGFLHCFKEVKRKRSHSITKVSFTMVRLSTAAFLLSLTSVGAFAPSVSSRRALLPLTPLNAAAIETPPSPLTIWGDKISNIRKLQEEMRQMDLPEFGVEISSKDLGLASDDKEAQLNYFKENAMEIKMKMQEHGALIFRGFDLMKEQEGFQAFYSAIGMEVCQDPLQSVSARPTADGKKDSPVYEAVNKESRKNFFIGKFDAFVYGRKLVWSDQKI